MEIQAAKPTPLLSIKVNQDKIDLRPEFQRGLVWDKERKQMLIDSILREKYIPEILFGKSEKPNYEESVIDGQQRMNTVLDFMNNKLKVKKGTVINGKDLSDLTFDELPEDIKNRVTAYTFNIVRINGTKTEIEDMFRRLQGGISLNKVETRHSMSGKVKNFVDDVMLKHPFFTDSMGVTPKNNKRFKYYEVAEQFLVLELTNVTTDIKDKNISELYNKYNETGIPEEIKEAIMEKLDFLNNTFASNYKSILSKKVNAINVYLVAREFIKENKNYNDYASEFADWYATFEQNRKSQRELYKTTGDCDKIYFEYFNHAAAGTGSKESLQGRQKVLLRSWYDYLKDVK